LFIKAIPKFVKHPKCEGDFEVFDRKIIEGEDCYVFLDKKIEKNTGVYKMFFFYFLFLLFSTFRVLKIYFWYSLGYLF
jgi:hypothetical protein